MKIINPANGELLDTISEDGAEELHKKFRLLESGFQAWKSKPLQERIGFVRRFSELLGEHAEDISLTLTREVGKPIQQSRNEIAGAIRRINWLTAQAEKYLADELMTIEDGVEERIVYEPLGIIGNISAWNYPYLVGINVIAPALMAGNVVLYKPSEYSTLTGLHIARLLALAGVPENVFQIAVGGPDTGKAMTSLHFQAFYFTGSYKTGKVIYEKMSTEMIPCHCELGGKDPLYVADDVADIAATAAATADGAFYNNGQSCCAVERLYVHENIYDRFVEEFVKEVSSYRSGSPEEAGVYIGALTRASQVDMLQEQVDEAARLGAKILTGGKRKDGPGNFFEPTVLTDVDHHMKIMRDESFGPVIGIMKVKDDEEAVRLMRDTEYGLTASVYSADRNSATGILGRVDAGTGYWNCCDRVSAPLPWSGRKHSGIGVTLSHAGIRAMTKPKAYHLISPKTS